MNQTLYGLVVLVDIWIKNFKLILFSWYRNPAQFGDTPPHREFLKLNLQLLNWDENRFLINGLEKSIKFWQKMMTWMYFKELMPKSETANYIRKPCSYSLSPTLANNEFLLEALLWYSRADAMTTFMFDQVSYFKHFAMCRKNIFF